MPHYPGLTERGALTFAGKVRLLAQTLMFRMKPRRDRPPASPSPCPAVPGGALARRMQRWSEEASPSWLHAHNMRVHAWGSLLAQVRGVRHDDELLFVASALHDLGLTEKFAPEANECFALAGARGARKLLQADGVPAEWIDRVCDAIALHLEVVVPVSRGAEAHLVHAGAVLDVLSLGRRQLHPESVAAVLAAWPRDEFGARIAQALTNAQMTAPSSRIAFYCRHAQFAERAASARWSHD